MTEIEENEIRNRKEDELKTLIMKILDEKQKKEDKKKQILDKLNEYDDDEDNSESNEKEVTDEKKSISRLSATFYQYQKLYTYVIFLIIISVVLIICGIFAQSDHYYFLYVDIYMFLTAIFMLPIPLLQWSFLLYYCILACAFFFVKNMAIFILDFRDFIHCNSVQCASVANFVFFQLYYVFSIFTIGVVIFLVKLMYYILYTRKFEDNISNSYDDGTKKLEIPEEFKKTV